MNRLQQAYNLNGFCGVATPGKREGRIHTPTGANQVYEEAYPSVPLPQVESEEEGEDEDEELQELDGVINYIADMSLDPYS